MQNNKNFLGTEPIGKLLLKLSIPTVIAQLINMLYNIVDRIYIGHIPGDGSLALTGVGVCMPIIMIVSAFAALVSSGGAPRASSGENIRQLLLSPDYRFNYSDCRFTVMGQRYIAGLWCQ